MKAQQQFIHVTQRQTRNDFQRLDVEIRLTKPVEEDNASRASPTVRSIAKVGLGVVFEAQAQQKAAADEQTNLLKLALANYLDVFNGKDLREGDTVEAGQLLLELDDTAARAELQRLFLRRIRLTAIDARLQAEMKEEDDVTWPPEIVHWLASSSEVKEIVDSQKMAFTARRNNLNSDVKSIQESINALDERIRGSRVQLEAVHRQIVLLDEEIVTKDKLVQAGLVRKPELMVLQRSKANLEGEVGRIMGDIGDGFKVRPDSWLFFRDGFIGVLPGNGPGHRRGSDCPGGWRHSRSGGGAESTSIGCASPRR